MASGFHGCGEGIVTAMGIRGLATLSGNENVTKAVNEIVKVLDALIVITANCNASREICAGEEHKKAGVKDATGEKAGKGKGARQKEDPKPGKAAMAVDLPDGTHTCCKLDKASLNCGGDHDLRINNTFAISVGGIGLNVSFTVTARLEVHQDKMTSTISPRDGCNPPAGRCFDETLIADIPWTMTGTFKFSIAAGAAGGGGSLLDALKTALGVPSLSFGTDSSVTIEGITQVRFTCDVPPAPGP